LTVVQNALLSDKSQTDQQASVLLSITSKGPLDRFTSFDGLAVGSAQSGLNCEIPDRGWRVPTTARSVALAHCQKQIEFSTANEASQVRLA
jgi:hypothetical protein